MANFLRFCATMFVFLLHGRASISGINDTVTVFRVLTLLPAWAGVWIFFCLSGYGLGMGFEKNRYGIIPEQGTVDITNLFRFYFSRLFKLAPLYVGYLLVFEILTDDSPFWGNHDLLVKMLTFTFNGNGGVSSLGHLWYVSIVMQLYLLMPFLYMLVRKIRSQRTVVLCMFGTLFVGLCARVLLHYAGKDWYADIYTNVFVNVDLALTGLLAARMNTLSTGGTKFCKIAALLAFLGLVVYNCTIYYFSTEICIYIYIGLFCHQCTCCFVSLYLPCGILRREKAVISPVFFLNSLNTLMAFMCFILHPLDMLIRHCRKQPFINPARRMFGIFSFSAVACLSV